MNVYPLSRSVILAAALAAAWLQPSIHAQSPTQQPPQPASAQSVTPQSSAEPAIPGGTVIFSRQAPEDPDSPAPLTESRPAPKPSAVTELKPDDDPLKVTDAERNALTFTTYDLDVHLIPASAGISVRSGLTLRNDSATPLTRLVLQISSSLHWDAFSSTSPTTHAIQPLKFDLRRVATDADHTGWVQEAVVTLPQPLAPGASLSLTALYSGAIARSAERLQRIGAPVDQAVAADWDAIAPNTTALRGFGNVLWYPVAVPPVFLGDGAKLFDAVGHARLRQQTASIRLRLAIEYVGDPPDAAFFCGRRQPLTALSDNPNLPVAEAPGIATAIFAPQPLGFRSPSLFITDHAPSQVNSAATQTDAGLIAAVTNHYDALPSYSAASALVEPLLTDWFGARPLAPLNLLDHPGQPFEDDTLLVRPVQVEDADTLAPSLVHSLTHAWIRSSHPWIDEGLPQFIGLLWTERRLGRSASVDALQEAARTLALAEPAPDSSTSTANPPTPPTTFSSSNPTPASNSPAAGQSLIDATSDIYYRNKAAAVWWMLRDLTGDDALKQALQAYRLDPKLDRDPTGFELTLEKFSHKDLRWFFNDWVYHDPGLPDLTIVNVTPRQLEARNGEPAGWYVSIEVRNDGDATADVPWTVRSGARQGIAAATETQRMRIHGHSTMSQRMVFAGTPEEVQLNDGSVPETRSSIHTRQLVLPGK